MAKLSRLTIDRELGDDPTRTIKFNFFVDGSIKMEVYYENSDPNIEGEDPRNQEVSLTMKERDLLFQELQLQRYKELQPQMWVSMNDGLVSQKNSMKQIVYTNE